jgi:serine/threonine protein kinase
MADPEFHPELHAWLKDHRLDQYYVGFVQKGFEELEDVADMGDEELSACGVTKMGHLNRARRAIEMLKKKRGEGGPAEQVLGRRFSSESTGSALSEASVASSGEAKVSSPNPSGYIVLNHKYRVYQNQNLATREGSCIRLAETNDAEETELIAKVGPKRPGSEREYQIMKHLQDVGGRQRRDKHVVILKDFVQHPAPGAVSDMQYLLMERGEWPDGTLAERFKFISKFHWTKKDALAVELLEICKFIHSCGVVWGDVKPGNYVRFKDPYTGEKFKAIDFDSSCFVSVSTSTPSTVVPSEFDRNAMFTPGYISPERAKAILDGRTIQAAPAQDVFALGLILFRVYTGAPFFSESDINGSTGKSYLERLSSRDFSAHDNLNNGAGKKTQVGRTQNSQSHAGSRSAGTTFLRDAFAKKYMARKIKYKAVHDGQNVRIFRRRSARNSERRFGQYTSG